MESIHSDEAEELPETNNSSPSDCDQPMTESHEIIEELPLKSLEKVE